MDERKVLSPWDLVAEPFVRAYQAEKEAALKGASTATRQRVERETTNRTLINKSILLERRRQEAGNCKVDLIDQKFVGKARELAHEGDKLRRLAQLPKATLRTA